MGKKNRTPKVVLTDEEAANIPFIPWLFESAEPKQHHLLMYSWNKNNHCAVYELLALCKNKDNKNWINNMRRALHTFKPPDFDIKIWNKLHELFKQSATPKQYVNASVIILPILAHHLAANDGESLQKTYESFITNIETIAQSDANYGGPSLRSIAALLSICCKQIKKELQHENVKKSIEIGLNLYKLSMKWKLNANLVETTSTEYFDCLFEIFAANKTSIREFNVLFHLLTKNVNNKILTQQTYAALKSYFATIENIEIYDNLASDLNGYLYYDHDEKRLEALQNCVKLPRFRLSAMENSEIWEQLRLTQINDESVTKYERKQLLLNKTRMEKLGLNQHQDVEQIAFFDENDEQNHRRKHKYDQFIKYMLNDGGAQVIIDGANVGHMIKQDRFSFDFVDHIASYYANTKNKKVRIIMTVYRVYNAETCNNERVKQIIEKWIKKKWLIKAPNQLYDDVLWSIYALHSCLIYDGKVIIVTNDEMRDHQMALNHKRLFQEFLETKLCRIQVFKDENKLAYDPFNESNNNPLKRKHNFAIEEQDAVKKQKIDINQTIITSQRNISFHSKYEYIHSVFPYKMHEAYSYVIKPQFYKYPMDDNMNEELVWFLPQICNTSDCKNPQNMLKQSYPNCIIQKRIRWIVAKAKRPINL